MVGVFFNLLEGLSIIRCTRACSLNLPAGQYSAAIVGELMMSEQFVDNIRKTNLSWAHENFSKQWINIRIEISLAVLTGIIAFFIWLSKILR
jgi:ABC-type multidrug transport system permease subunit